MNLQQLSRQEATGNAEPQQLFAFVFEIFAVVAMMYVAIAGILVAYGTTCIKFR
jgi:hypothetical protein